MNEQDILGTPPLSADNNPTGSLAYFRFPLSFRDIEEMLAERGIEVIYETIRRWVLKFGPAIAANVRSRRVRPSLHFS